jgi:hypothetical protein
VANYANAKDVYEELRKTLGTWTAAHGFRRWPGMVAGWQRAAGPLARLSPGDGGDQLLRFGFEGSSRWGDSETGHSLTGRVQLDPSPGDLAETPLRQSTFTGCLIRPELDRLAAIQGTINRRRPALPAQYAADFEADTLLGLYLRALYDPSPSYQEGEYVPLSYYSMEDVRQWSRFIIDVLPVVLDRFVAGRTPRPIDTTPEHLKPKVLRFVR